MGDRNLFWQCSTSGLALIAILAGGVYGAPAVAQVDKSAADREDRLDQEIIVTGSRLSGRGIDGPAPVSVLSAEDISRLGATTVEDVLRNSPFFNGAALNSGSAPAALLDSGRTIGQTQADLRGVGAEYTLALLDGRRISAIDPANLALLPRTALRSVEILKAGASALYGSDAVAGVVNLRTRRDENVTELFVQQGISSRGDAPATNIAGAFGRTWSGLSVFTAIEYTRKAELRIRDRERTANRDFSRFDPTWQPSVLPYASAAQVFLPDGTGPLTLDLSRFGRGTFSNNPADYGPLDPQAYIALGNELDTLGEFPIQSGQESVTGFASIGYSVSADTEFRVDFLYGRGTYTSGKLLWGFDLYGDDNLDFGPLPADHPWNPFGVELRDIFYGLPEIGPPRVSNRNSTFRVAPTFKTRVLDTNLEFGATYFQADNRLRQSNYTSLPGLVNALYREGPAALNPFCYACNTPEQIAGIVADDAFTSNRTKLLLFDARAQRNLFELPAGPLGALVGAEWRRESLNQRPSQNILDGDLYFFTVRSFDFERTVQSVFGEVSVPITGGDFSVPGFRELAVDLALRGERISDVGTTWDPRVSVRWQPFGSELVLRGSWGTSFRAPPAEALFVDQQRELDILFDPVTNEITTYEVITGGNPDLRPETAETLTLGAVIRPFGSRSVTATIDYYRLDQRDIIFTPDPDGILAGTSPGIIIPGEGAFDTIIATFFNGASRTVEGIDAEINYNGPLSGQWSLDLALAATHLLSFRVDTGDGNGPVNYAGAVAERGLQFRTGLPTWRANGTVGVSTDRFRAGYSLNYIGGYDNRFVGSGRTGRFVTHDLQFSYRMGATDGQAQEFTFGIENIADKMPPYFEDGFGADGYDRGIAIPLGRFFYVSGKLRF